MEILTGPPGGIKEAIYMYIRAHSPYGAGKNLQWYGPDWSSHEPQDMFNPL